MLLSFDLGMKPRFIPRTMVDMITHHDLSYVGVLNGKRVATTHDRVVSRDR